MLTLINNFRRKTIYTMKNRGDLNKYSGNVRTWYKNKHKKSGCLILIMGENMLIEVSSEGVWDHTSKDSSVHTRA